MDLYGPLKQDSHGPLKLDSHGPLKLDSHGPLKPTAISEYQGLSSIKFSLFHFLVFYRK